MSTEARATATAILIPVATIVAICSVLLARDPMFFWVCDYQLWYSGIFEEIARAWDQGEWPILTQGSWAVPSLAGEYQCGTFSLFFNLSLVLIWKLPLGLAAKAATLSILHLVVLAAGAALLARQRGLSLPGSTLIAIVAAMNGWIINWAATDWFVALSGFAWVPWSWWALEVASSTSKPRVRWLLAAPFIYLTITAGSPFAVLMLAFVSVWLALRTFASERSLKPIGPLAFAWCIGLGLSAPAWLMLIEYHRSSVRGSWPQFLHWSWVVPWRAWLGLILPSFTTDWRQWSGFPSPHYCIEMAGGFVPLAALITQSTRGGIDFLRRHRWDFLLLCACAAVVSLPSIGSFRWSFRSMPLLHLTLALLGATALERIDPKRLAICAALLLGAASLIAVASGTNASTIHLVVTGAIVLAWAALSICSRASALAWGPAVVSTALLLATYLTLSTRQSVSRHEFRENLLSPKPLDPDRLYLGIHSFNDILRDMDTPGWGAVLRPCNTLMLAQLHFLNGYSSFSVTGVPAFFETHGSLQPQTVDALLGPECIELLDLLGVDGLVFGPDYVDRTSDLGLEWQVAHRSDEAIVYHREPRRHTPAKTLRRIDTRPNERLARPEITIRKNGRQTVILDIAPLPSAAMTTNAEGGYIIPSLDPTRPVAIAFARPILPGYRATLDGKELPVISYQDFVPVVEVPPGASGQLILTYSPRSFRLGLMAAAVAALALLIAFICSNYRDQEVGHSR